jgi:hypothetical protein
VFVHVSKENRKKMEPLGKKGVFVGYSKNSKDYMIYVLGQRHIEVIRDVTFHEEDVFKKSIEIEKESEAVHPASPSSKNEESHDQRKEPHEGLSNEPLEIFEELEMTLE